MYQKLFSSLLIMGTVLAPSPVFSSSYEPLKYPLKKYLCSGDPCLINSSSISNHGYTHLDTSAVDYFYNLVNSNKVTSEGYPYSYCRFRVDITVNIDSINKWGENMLGYNGYRILYKTSSSGSVSYKGSNSTNFDTKVSPSSLPSSIVKKMQDHNIELTKRYSSNNVIKNYYSAVTIRADDYYFYRYGCDMVPVEVKPPNPHTCPNLVIRGLPFIRNTITCHQKNR